VIEFSTDRDSITAFGDAEVLRGEVAAHARVATLSGEDQVVLEGDPEVRQKGDRLSGERILIFGHDGEISRVVALGKAVTNYEIEGDDPAEEPQHGIVKGDTLTMFFEEGDPVLTVVRGRAVSEHYVGTSGEMNTVGSRQIDVIFSEGRIERAVFRGNASGVYSFRPEEPPTSGGEESEAQEAPGEVAPTEPPTSGGEEGEAQEAPGEAAPTEPITEAGETAPTGPITEAGETVLPPGVDAGTAADDPIVESAPSDSVVLETVVYNSGRIDYYVVRNRIVLSDTATVEYLDTVLTADEVVFDPDGQTLAASGNPDLREKSDRLVGKTLNYQLEERAGTIDEGITTFEAGLYYGERIHREGDGSLKVRGAVYTTCSHAEPHYRIESQKMKIYLDDKVVARPVILYLGEIPVFGLPFYVFPIRQGRHSGFLIPRIDVGFSEDKGRFIKNFGYYWAPNDYWDLTGWGDFYEQTRWIGHLEARYKKRYALSGSIEASFMQQLLENRRRWDLTVNHRQEFGRTWTMGASGDFRSDATYASDSNQSIQESANRSLHSQLWMRGRWSRVSIGVTLDRREEIDDDVVSELLPRINLNGSQRPLLPVVTDASGLREWLQKTSYSWSAQAVNDRDSVGDESEVHQGVGVRASFRNSGKYMGWLNVTPRFDVRQNWYDRDKAGREFRGRFTYDAGVTAGTTVYGTFFPELGPLEGVRHIIEPAASYTWTPDLTQYFDESGSDEFFTFSGFGATPRKRQSMSVSLVNKLQLKMKSGADTKKIDNFLRLSTSSSYDLERDEEPWSDLQSSLDVRPGRPLSLRWNTSHDPYTWNIQRSSMTATVNLRGDAVVVTDTPWEDRIAGVAGPAEELRNEIAQRSVLGRPGARPWDASATFRYSRGADPGAKSYWLDSRFAFSLTRNWRVNYAIHYDLEEREVASQEYTVYRDLHCWEAQFTSRYYEGAWQYYFQINVKELPEIQLEQGEKFLKRSVR